MTQRVMLVGICTLCLSLGIASALPATGIEDASRLYLNQALFHLRQAQLYASRSSDTVPLAGFDYDALQQDLDLVADGVATFLQPRHGDPVRVVPTQIDGRYLSEVLRTHRLTPPSRAADEEHGYGLPGVQPEVLE